MNIYEAQRLVRQVWGVGGGIGLETVNGIKVVSKHGKRLGVGPSWKSALRAAVLKDSKARSFAELQQMVEAKEAEKLAESTPVAKTGKALKVALAVAALAGTIGGLGWAAFDVLKAAH